MSLTSRRRRANHRAREVEADKRECERYVAEYERIERQRMSGEPAIGPLRVTMTDTINIRTGMLCIGVHASDITDHAEFTAPTGAAPRR